MRSLFLKIFLWFWGATVVIGLTLYLVVTTTRPDPLPKAWREQAGATLAAHAAGAVALFEQQGVAATEKYLDDQEQQANMRLHLCDANGKIIAGGPNEGEFGRGGGSPGFGRGEGRDRRGPPDGGGRPFGGKGPRDEAPPDPPFFDFPLFNGGREPRRPDDWLTLNRDALENDTAAFNLSGPRVLAAQSIKAASGKRYILQGIMPRPEFGRPVADAGRQAMGILVMFLMSGLVCYGLVRYLTSPMVALREATQQLAAGDLTARTGAANRARRDEVADLGRDFDAMAERIETLVVSQRRLLGDISHELRSPLARVNMALALGRRHVAQGSSVDEINADFDRIKREATRINDLIEQLLQLARLDSGEVEGDTQRLDLAHLLGDVVADADYEAQETKRAVRILSSQQCYLNGSLSLVASAIENVVRNAVRYTNPNTIVEVTLQCALEGQQLIATVRVRDHGPGVPEEALEKLFRPFYRVADARDRATGGVGLGLAITERAIHSHGGSVKAQNAPGGGLVVELKLPVEMENK